ncbi:hypothetical protein [Streptomyces sp. NPDC088752]|uniref:hypothetical protein n=1 Tax=Streptomyces sp. NPDC088752 TaxID=3154963 RepID=UPI0034234332
MTPRIIEHDDDSVTVGIVPQDCAACGARTDRVRLAMEPVSSSMGDFLGLQTIATTPCCNGKRSGHYPVESLARLLDHLQTCPNH